VIRRYLLISFLVILIAVLAYLLRGVMLKYLLSPIIYALRIFSIIYRALPQAFWWGAFLLILVVVSSRLIFRKRAVVNLREGVLGVQPASLASAWAHRIERSKKGDYSKWLLARSITELALNTIAFQERQSLEIAQKRLLEGKIDLPPKITAYIQAGLDMPSFRHYSEFIANFRYARTNSPLELDVEEIIEFLENNAQSM